MSHPDSTYDETICYDVCVRCGGADESNGGNANMVDGRGGMCAVCADDMGVK